MSSYGLDRQSEIDAFKKINLSVIASHFGYRIVKRKSTRHSVLMESVNDKIIVSKNGSHYVYCSVYDTASSGTAIDLVQQVIEPNCSLGRVRQILRPFQDGAFYANVRKQHEGKFAHSIRPSSTDFLAVAARLFEFQPVTESQSYLCGERGIPSGLLQQDRVRGRILHCQKRNAIIFPHWGFPGDDPADTERCINGYEIKGPSVNLFSKSGRKGLWATRGFSRDRILAFTESGLDALSYLALHPSNDIRVCSVSGQLNPFQHHLIRSAIGKMGESAQVVAAFDNDEAGDRLTDTLKEIVHCCQRDYVKFHDDRPAKRGDDWNSTLQVTSSGSDNAQTLDA